MDVKELFQENIYGYAPLKPHNAVYKTQCIDENAYGGKAYMYETNIRFSLAGEAMHVLSIIPKHTCVGHFLTLNSFGNHTASDNENITISEAFFASENAEKQGLDIPQEYVPRGFHAARFCVDDIIEAGFGFITCHESDIRPDHPSQAFQFPNYDHLPFEHESYPGVIMHWAWGLMRIKDFIDSDDFPSPVKQTIVTGHSRRGKAAFVAGAFDPRFAAIIPHQSGTFGVSPSVKNHGETIKQINDAFPHWFCKKAKIYNDEAVHLPVEQFDLLTLCFPRPFMAANALQDHWADPDGAFTMLKKIMPLYIKEGYSAVSQNEYDEKIGDLSHEDRLCYFIREGEHGLTQEDWHAFIAFARHHLNG